MPSLSASPSLMLIDDDESDLTPLTDTDFSDSDDSDFEASAPPAKRRRVSQQKPKEKAKKKEVVKVAPKKLRAYKGVLQEMWALPLDVTYEIFGRLKPLDLLQLSRTSKKLRSLLLGRSSKSVWIQARANVEGLPECPFDMSEPAYASLAFEAYCHYCYANNVQTVIWEARVRCCKRCGGTMFTHWVNLVKENIPDVLRCLVPGTHEFTSGTVYPHTEKKYSLEQAVILMIEMSRLSDDEQPLWFWNKKKEYDRIVEHAALCRDFISGRHTRRNRELDEARIRRTKAIITKLTELGWGDEIAKMQAYRLAEHKHVKIPKDLTERAWQKIEADMVAFMEEIRSKRIAKEKNKIMSLRCSFMKQTYANFVASQPLHAILPGVADYATMPELKAVLDDPDLEREVTLGDFKIGDDKMLEFAAQWRDDKDKELLEILRQSSVGASASKEMLSRATTLFNCKTCNVPISYPRILVHTCNFARSMEVPDPTNVFERLRAEPWNLGGDRVSFHEAAHKRAKHILKALSLPPETTVDQMTETNPFVECYCAICYRPGAIRTFARWSRMVEHTPRYTASHVPKPYGAVDGRRSALVKKLENVELSKLRREHDWGDYSHRSYCCTVCKTRDTRHAIEKHVIQDHSIAIPQFATDYTYHLDAKMKLRAPFVNLKITPKPKNAEVGSSTAAATTSSSSTIPLDIAIQTSAASSSTSVPLTPSSSLAIVVAQLAVSGSSDSDASTGPAIDAPQIATSSSAESSVSGSAQERAP